MLRIQNEILRMIADDEALDETARRICASLKGALPGVIGSILTVDRAGRRSAGPPRAEPAGGDPLRGVQP